ncbi:hypothetical protein L211DRAFT_853342 [Terfezia boudieri ATCC MYA-4762]|uniref:Uncharacterized protein n=1 Tax=Terfezia boudieri ATCC MYA-4762 TaxID=1051890 RepID=A0A3N4LCX2_9PEZI|nr:hypothetical protein L211DRAFT_853342 [Terfezia boudieri ATCC MYA-4762]
MADDNTQELPAARGRKRQYPLESDTEPEASGQNSTQPHHKITLGSVTVSRGDGTPLVIIAPGDHKEPSSKFVAKNPELSGDLRSVKKRKHSHVQLESGLGDSPCQDLTPIGTHSPPTAITGPVQQSMCGPLVSSSGNVSGLYQGTTPASVKQTPSQSAASPIAYMTKECGNTPQKITSHVTPKKKLEGGPGIKGTTKSVDVNFVKDPSQLRKRKNHDPPRRRRIHKMPAKPEKSNAALESARRAAIALELELARDSESNYHIKIPVAPPVQSGIKTVELRSCLSNEKSKTQRETGEIKRRVEWDPAATLHTYPVNEND